MWPIIKMTQYGLILISIISLRYILIWKNIFFGDADIQKYQCMYTRIDEVLKKCIKKSGQVRLESVSNIIQGN